MTPGGNEGVDQAKRRILERVDLAALIGEQVALTRKSGHSLGCCPFHAEKTPSFYVYPDHYHCFGCQAHGDAITYVRQQQGLGFIEAIRWLASKYSLEVPELDQARGRGVQRAQDAHIYQMLLAAQDFFVANLNAEGAGNANAYLLARGFTSESIKAFGFGLTPADGSGLVRHLRQRRFNDEDMITYSLATRSTRDGRAFDFFRQRLTLPIHDAQGRIVGFGGRTLDGANPKYLNSRDNRLFDKSRLLFGLHKARTAMRERGRALVVEGYMDVLMLWQAGFPEAVACMGTALSEAHLKTLSHATGQAILLFDGDAAGQKATLGTVNTALTVPDLAVRAAVLPLGEDPDTFVRQQGAEALSKLLASGSDLLDFAIRARVKITPPLGIPELVRKEFVPWLAQISEPLQRGYLISRIAGLTGVPQADLVLELAHANPAAAQLAAKANRRQGGLVAPGESTMPADLPLPPLADLDRLAYDLFGHAFHAQPGELDAEAVAAVVREDLDLSVEHTALIIEIIADLRAGARPALQPPERWSMALDPRVLDLVERLRQEAAAFACLDRGQRVARLRRELERRRLKQGIARLKSEMIRVSADPERRGEIKDFLNNISLLNKEMQRLG